MSALQPLVTLVIESPRKPPRFAPLGPGAHALGAALDCDVVLIDEGVRDRHAAILVEETGLTVAVEPGAEAALDAGGGAKARDLADGPAPWWPGQRLALGDLRIGVEPAPGAAFAPSPPSRTRKTLKVAAPLAAVAAAVIVYVSPPAFNASAVVAEASAPVDSAVFEEAAPHAMAMSMLSAPVASPPDAMQVRADLAPFGFDPVELTPTADGWRAVVYVADATLARRLTAVAADLPYPLETLVRVDADLAAAASMVLGNLGVAGVLRAVEAGVAEVEIASPALFADEGRRRAIETMLLGDVEGLRKVEFRSQIAGDIAALQRMIAGVWAGDRPYVALTDGKVVRVGEDLVDGVGLVALDGVGRLVLTIDGAAHSIELN